MVSLSRPELTSRRQQSKGKLWQSFGHGWPSGWPMAITFPEIVCPSTHSPISFFTRWQGHAHHPANCLKVEKGRKNVRFILLFLSPNLDSTLKLQNFLTAIRPSQSRQRHFDFESATRKLFHKWKSSWLKKDGGESSKETFSKWQLDLLLLLRRYSYKVWDELIAW